MESTSVNQTHTIAKDFLRTLHPKENKALVVGLSGNLGSGKTTFMQGVAKTFGITDTVTSPTFVIMKHYPLIGQPFEQLVHIDAYRLEKGEELLVLGWDELINNPKNVIMIEWPEIVADVLPENIRTIDFTFINDTTRIIHIHGT